MIVSWHRKYRPKRVEELDQEKVRRHFETFLKTGKFTQAYLFTGPKGTGKTTAARLLALIVNCEVNSDAIKKGTSLKDPCGTCAICQSILEGGSSCVLEMDAASNRGIDDIRQLRERINLMPQSGSFSVYIIDEVHMLTTEAFNALLKTLEEPPAHVIFCLCTTELHKLPETIISRCTKIEYGLSSETEIVRSLERVVTGEKLVVENGVLQQLASSGNGSFRDAVKYLEQLAISGSKITLETLEHSHLSGSFQSAETLLGLLYENNTKAALEFVSTLSNRGGKLDDLSKRVVELGLQSIRQNIAKSEPINAAHLQLVEIFSKAFTRFNQVPIASLALEMAIVEYGLFLGSIQKSAPTASIPVQPSPTSATKPIEQQVLKSESTIPEVKKKVKSKTNQEEKHLEDKPLPETDQSITSTLQLSKDLLNKNWQEFIKKVELGNHAIGTVLKGATILSCNGNSVELEVAYSFHKRQLEQDRYLKIIDTAAIEIYGDRIIFAIKLGQSEKIPKSLHAHDNVSPSIKSEDEALINAVEEVFGT